MSDIKDMLMNLKPQPTPFHAKSWGADLHIRALTERERRAFSDFDNPELSHEERIKRVCLAAIVRETGVPVFDSIEEMDGLWFGGFTEVYNAVVQLTLGTFEEAKKN